MSYASDALLKETAAKVAALEKRLAELEKVVQEMKRREAAIP